MLFVVLAVLTAGCAVAVQSPLMSLVASHIGLVRGITFVTLGSTLAMSAILLITRQGFGTSVNLRSALLALGAGALGAGVMIVLAWSVRRLGVLSTLVLSIAAQLIVGALLDHLGLLGLETRLLNLPRVAGMLVLLAGAFLVVR